MNALRREVEAETLPLATSIAAFQFTTYIHFQEDYYV